MLSKEEINDFNQKLNSLSKETLHEMSKKELSEAQDDFIKFKKDLLEGKCYLCKNNISHFLTKKPCPHWLLKPKGFKKKYFPLLYETRGYHKISDYLKWVANTERPIVNINNLNSEKSKNKVIEETIKYKNIEWSFSSTKGDIEGHTSSARGNFPHYHFQMKIDNNVMINFNGFHIPFNHYDKWAFSLKNNDFNNAKLVQIQGAGMQDFFDTLSPEEILNNSKDFNKNIKFKEAG